RRTGGRVAWRVRSTSCSSHSPSCSTSTLPRIVPSSRTSRRSGADASSRALRVDAEGGEDMARVGLHGRDPSEVGLNGLGALAADHEDDAGAVLDLSLV